MWSDRPVADLDQLERIAAVGWRGLVEQPLGEWVLRASNGFTGRANSTLALGNPGLPLDDALRRVEQFSSDHHLPAVFQVPFAQDDPIGNELRRRAWSSFHESIVLVGPVRSGPVRSGVEVRPQWRVDHAPVPSQRWLSGYSYRGRPLPEGAFDVLVNADFPTFVTLTERGEQLGVARGVVTDSWLGVTAVTVEPAHRRRGVASALMTELQQWAGGRGAREVYLQVAVENAAALAMYSRLGFTEHHRYRYWRRPVEQSPHRATPTIGHAPAPDRSQRNE